MMDNLKIINTIQSNERYDAYEAEFDGQKVFAKKAKMPKTEELLRGVPKNSDVVNNLGAKSASFTFRAPKTIASEANLLITEWIDGQPLGAILDKEPENIATVLAKFFIVFDDEPVKPEGFRIIFTKEGLKSRMSQRLPKSLSEERKTVLKDAKKLFDELCASLLPSLQDADIKPEHIFLDPNKAGAYVLIDSEHLSPQWPRFYDLGNNIAKYWVRNQKEFSSILTRTFLQGSKIAPDIIFRPLVATLLVRGISMHWETDYDPGAENYNIPRAQAMLKACLAANNLDDLLYLSTEDE